MKEEEIKEGVVLSGIKSNRIVGKLSLKEGEPLFTYKETPPYIVEDTGDSSYKFLGTEKTTRGENLHKYSVRRRKNKKDKHFTLEWSGLIKKVDIRDIEDEDEIRNPETIEKYKIVTSRLRLPKRAVKNLINDYNEFLYPTPKKVDTPSKLFDILRLPYALDILKYFSENEEMTRQGFKNATNVKESKSFKYLDSFEKLGVLRSYKQGRSSIKIYRITLEKKRIAKIMDALRD